MTWTYSQSTGELSHNGEIVGTGYSGVAEGLNNPDMQSVPNIGPLPQGNWILGPAFTDPKLGPIVMRLSPEFGTETYGRASFFVHGDNGDGLEDSSHGCIVLSRPLRLQISQSNDNDLTVVA